MKLELGEVLNKILFISILKLVSPSPTELIRILLELMVQVRLVVLQVVLDSVVS